MIGRWVRLVLLWAVALYLAQMFVTMGWVKLSPDGFWTGAFERWGYPPWFRVAIGVIEVASGLMLLLPGLATYGALGLAAVMAGAWWTRYQDGRFEDVVWITAYVVALLGVGVAWSSRRWRRSRPKNDTPGGAFRANGPI